MIELLIGCIGSGKSTYCKKRAEEGAIIVNDDAIVEALHGGNYRLYDKKIKSLYKSVEINACISAIQLGKDVIIDRGLSLTKNSRKRWIGIAQSFDIPIQATLFKFVLPYEHAKRRYNSDNRGLEFVYWWNVALQHASIYERPSLDEGFNSIVVNNVVADTVEFMLNLKNVDWTVLSKAMQTLEAGFQK